MSQTLLVTGSSGFVGSAIIRMAVDEGFHVVALKRRNSNVSSLAGLPIEWRVGDVTDTESLDRAFKNIDLCIHTAGATSYNQRDRDLLRRVNIDGARNVALAAKKNGVKRFVHTSSVSAIGFSPQGEVVDETTPYNWPRRLPYMETKAEGERTVRECADDSFQVVIVNPATIMGAAKMNASEEQLVDDVKHNKVVAIPPGGMTVCEVNDIARGHLLALQHGRSQERYILGGHHLTHAELVRRLAEKFGVPTSAKPWPAFVFKTLGGILMYLEPWGVDIGNSATEIRLSRFGVYHSSEKAVRELGYSITPLDTLLEHVVSTRQCESITKVF